MVLKNPQKAKAKKKKTKKLNSLNLAIALLLLWLLAVLTAGFFYINKESKENMGQIQEDAASSAEKETDKVYFKLLAPSNTASDSSANADLKASQEDASRDEFQPPMETLFRDRELTIEKIESLFKNWKSPKEMEPMHSTFGKEVVYVYHSHSREAFLPYLKGAEKPEEAFHSKGNITLVGKMIGESLERRGMETTVNSSDIVEELDARGLDYGSSYSVSREHVQAAQKENSELDIFLDIHRDSLRKTSTTASVNGKDYAQLLFVVGTGHQNFKKNLAFSEGLHQQLNVSFPGISKGILEKSSAKGNGIYNQDLSANSVIVEIGGVDSTVEELNRTVEALADVLSDNYWHGEK
ncbi:stage II sporulation protein P [Planococcus sp. YIM B11945]|uniref:stage II sporulation protein P n=1 Tax=Planococcus sp. YIM B11945 TaxID=3435410 RepID=UPI003D7EF446